MTQTVLPLALSHSECEGRWGRHRAVTHEAMEAMLRRAMSDRGQPTLQERVLASIVEFRTLTADDGLAEYLRVDALRKLGEARFALHEIGAADMAARVGDAIAGLRRTSRSRGDSARVWNLQQELRAAGPLLDDLIAVYASRVRRRLMRASRYA